MEIQGVCVETVSDSHRPYGKRNDYAPCYDRVLYTER